MRLLCAFDRGLFKLVSIFAQLLLVAAAAARWFGRVLRANPSLHDERAAALEVGLHSLSSPH